MFFFGVAMSSFFDSLRDSREAISERSRIDQVFVIFWLIGPFFLLIERTPGDAWITVLALSFMVRAFFTRDFSFFQWFWVKAAFLFWAVCLLSALMSSHPIYAFGEAFAWVRFPLFAMACVFWLGTDKRILITMLYLVALAFLLMCCILTAEIIVDGFKARLSWPYGDLVSGNFLAKAGLPAITTAAALAVTLSGKRANAALFFVAVGLFFVFLTGERINSLILLCGALLSALIVAKNWRQLFKFGCFGLIAVAVVFLLNRDALRRYGSYFIEQLPLGDHSSYYNTMAPALVAFKQNPILGVGSATLREACPNLVGLQPNMECDNHPHNYYIQLLGETGILGFICGVVFLSAIVWVCFKGRLQYPESPIASVAWVVPFALFWPIASTADFFGQWNNIFMWSSVALALSISCGEKTRPAITVSKS